LHRVRRRRSCFPFACGAGVEGAFRYSFPGSSPFTLPGDRIIFGKFAEAVSGIQESASGAAERRERLLGEELSVILRRRVGSRGIEVAL